MIQGQFSPFCWQVADFIRAGMTALAGMKAEAGIQQEALNKSIQGFSRRRVPELPACRKQAGMTTGLNLAWMV